MKTSITLASILGATLILSANQVPTQFRVWGRKAPEKLSSNPVRLKHGIASIPIPKNMKQVSPETNKSLDKNAITKYAKSGAVPFNWHPMKRIYNVTTPFSNIIGKPSRAITTPGEYVPLIAAFHALTNLSCVEVKVEPFTSKKTKFTIPSYCIDLRRMMDLPIPTIDDPQKYQIEPRYLESFDEFDILNVKKGTTERFWITVKVPENCPAGIYRSKITFQARDKDIVSQTLMLRVLPFTLQKPNPNTEMTFAMLSGLNDPRLTLWGRDKQPQLALRQMVDMAEHGMTSNTYEHNNPHVTRDAKTNKLTLDFDRPGMTCVHSMNDFMHLVKRAKLTGPFGFYNGPYEWACYMLPGLLKLPLFSKEYNDAYRQLVLQVEKQRQLKKWPHFIWFTGDEPASTSAGLRRSENAGQQILSVLPKAEVTNFFNGMHYGVKDWKLMKKGATIVCANFFNKDVLKEIKQLGYTKHWNYNSVGNYPSDFRGDRIAFGVLPWNLKSSGVAQYILRETPAKGKNIEFSIYDQVNYGRTDYDFTYPAADGPIPTPRWESVRQGVYDYYYLYTLNKLIKKNPNSNASKAAQAEIDEIMKLIPHDYATKNREVYMENISPETLDAWRWRIAQQIMKLKKENK